MTYSTKLSHNTAPITLVCSLSTAAGSAATICTINSACVTCPECTALSPTADGSCPCLQVDSNATEFVRCELLQQKAATSVQQA